MKILSLIGILALFLVGCTVVAEKPVYDDPYVAVDTEGVVVEDQKFCVLIASDENDGYFLMIDELFQEGIPCDALDDCYQALLLEDDYRDLVPDVDPYLNCE